MVIYLIYVGEYLATTSAQCLYCLFVSLILDDVLHKYPLCNIAIHCYVVSSFIILYNMLIIRP